MGILFWYFPYIIFSAACGLVLPTETKDFQRRQNAETVDRTEAE